MPAVGYCFDCHLLTRSGVPELCILGYALLGGCDSLTANVGGMRLLVACWLHHRVDW